jgi:Tripartite tricarboxylate transporter family receptor
VDAAYFDGEAPALTDLLGGQVQVYFGPIPASIEHIRSGKLRALGVTTKTRLEVLPDIPTVGDFLSGYEAGGWQGIGAHFDSQSFPGMFGLHARRRSVGLTAGLTFLTCKTWETDNMNVSMTRTCEAHGQTRV